MTTKTFANRSNARRAAKAAGLDLATLAFVEVSQGAWTWTPVVAAYANGDQLVSFSDVETPGAYSNDAKARRYKLHNRKPAKAAAPVAPAAAAPTPAAKPASPKAAAGTPPAKVFEVYGKSSVLGPVALVHGYLDKLVAEGKPLVRKDALYELSQMGVNRFTARTQYQRWAAKRAGK
jgi:hypothetical protein